MQMNIFVNNNNNVETYLVDINIEKLKELQKAIILSTEKGDIKKNIAKHLRIPNGDILEIISKRKVVFIRKSLKKYNFKQYTSDYLFEYYLYKPHFLSIICDVFVKNNETTPINYSFYIRKLLEYKPINDQDEIFLNDLISCFSFNKYTDEQIVESNIDLSKKKNILDKLKALLFKQRNVEKFFLPKEYIDIIDEKIRLKEYISSQKRFRTIRYSEEYKNQIKKKNLYSLPKKESLKEQNII